MRKVGFAVLAILYILFQFSAFFPAKQTVAPAAVAPAPVVPAPVVDTAKLEQERKEAEQREFAERKKTRVLEMQDTETFLKKIIEHELEAVFPSASVQKKHLTVRVANEWHYQPYQIRLQAAQNVYEIWFKVANTPDDTRVKMTIADTNGNTVGGKDSLYGVWVDK
jgi:hypothetical protein